MVFKGGLAPQAPFPFRLPAAAAETAAAGRDSNPQFPAFNENLERRPNGGRLSGGNAMLRGRVFGAGTSLV